RSACLWRNHCLPIFVQQRYKRLQLAGLGAPAPHQPGGEPAPARGAPGSVYRDAADTSPYSGGRARYRPAA
ncbi:hypothetical protein, partial [Acinetobacter variabilis]|uniref:hypothetical protein n=1 Tax=Acinetobacter variabilis TaxID=70346 RepID=UPI0030F8047C